MGLHPRAYYFHNFLTKAERAHIIKLAAPKIRRSTVVGQNGEGVVDDIRTSYGMFIRRLEDPVITRIEKRISLWTHLPVDHQEDIQVRARALVPVVQAPAPATCQSPSLALHN